MNQYLEMLFKGQTLTRSHADQAMEQILSERESSESISAFLGALRVRAETPVELLGFANKLLEKSIPMPVQRKDLIDTCGTGGDRSHTFNISTTAGMVLAACGVGVAKHGNRSVSSNCGSADVLEALGVKVDHSPEDTARSIENISFGFQFAPLYHPALKKVGTIRKAIKTPTLFNLLGPLLNPARVSYQVVGVFDVRMLKTMSYVLDALGTQEAMVVHGDQGLDEVSLSGPTQVCHLKDGVVRSYTLNPEDFGLCKASIEELRGGDAQENAKIIESLLKGEERGPKRDVVLLNTAAGLVVSKKARDFKQGIELAKSAIDSGKAHEVLEKLRKFH